MNRRAMSPSAVRAICFDLDNTLWDVEPVLARAERILTDWLRARYPRIPERFSPEGMLEVRAALLREQPGQAHDFTYLRRETLARLAQAAGYERDMANEAFATWHAARNQCVPFADVVPALETLSRHFRLATLSNGNADLGTIGLAHHFEVSLHAAALGCAKPEPRAYSAVAHALTLQPAEILFVGDDPHSDVAGPRSAGMQTVWVNRGGCEWPAEFAPADHVIAGLDGLVSLVRELEL
jgi:FMN hydrolase / 5-amino-6-(5-phospho-D-ribitylamino)uracil phosphatase